MAITIKTKAYHTTDIHKFTVDALPALTELQSKIAGLYDLKAEDIQLYYMDSEGDTIIIKNDEELSTAKDTIGESSSLTIFVYNKNDNSQHPHHHPPFPHPKHFGPHPHHKHFGPHPHPKHHPHHWGHEGRHSHSQPSPQGDEQGQENMSSPQEWGYPYGYDYSNYQYGEYPHGGHRHHHHRHSHGAYEQGTPSQGQYSEESSHSTPKSSSKAFSNPKE